MDNKPYVNKGSMHLHGVTWHYTERTPFAGEVINGVNRKEIIERVAREFKEKNPDATASECYARGKHYVNRERKHYKSYLKGKNSYSYKGGKYLVEDLQRKMVFEQFNKEMEERFKELELKKEQENVEIEVG